MPVVTLVSMFGGIREPIHGGSSTRSGRRRRGLRCPWIWLPLALLLGCASPSDAPPGTVSCQPYGYSPAPIAFSFAPGPVTSAAAEQTAAELFRSCGVLAAAISDLTVSSKAAAGVSVGPNAGSPVWLVQVDATVSEGSTGASYQSHFLIEVNQATGRPTVIGYG